MDFCCKNFSSANTYTFLHNYVPCRLPLVVTTCCHTVFVGLRLCCCLPWYSICSLCSYCHIFLIAMTDIYHHTQLNSNYHNISVPSYTITIYHSCLQRTAHIKDSVSFCNCAWPCNHNYAIVTTTSLSSSCSYRNHYKLYTKPRLSPWPLKLLLRSQ